MDPAGSDFGADFGPQVPHWFLWPQDQRCIRQVEMEGEGTPPPPPRVQTHPLRLHPCFNSSTPPMRVKSRVEQPKFFSHQWRDCGRPESWFAVHAIGPTVLQGCGILLHEGYDVTVRRRKGPPEVPQVCKERQRGLKEEVAQG